MFKIILLSYRSLKLSHFFNYLEKEIIVIGSTNNIRNIWTDWPLGQNEFERFIVKKYGSISAAQSSTYRNIAQQDIYKANNSIYLK